VVCPAGAIKERQEDFEHLECFEQLRLFRKRDHIGQYICGVCVKACRGQGSGIGGN
jgi:epoxyqueuosine reductase QueG